jgi:hypothetical protein
MLPTSPMLLVSYVINVPYDLSTTSDILQVTTNREGLKFHYCVDMEHVASDFLFLSTLSDDNHINSMVNQLPKDIPIPKTRIIRNPGTILRDVTTPELPRDSSSLDYD